MELNQLIAEIARTTGLRLDRSDPILAAAAINEVLLDQALMKLDRQVKAQADRVTAASTQAVLDAKTQAEAMLTEAGEWIEARIKTAGEAAAERVTGELRKETRKAEKARRTTVRVAWAMAVVGLIVLSALGGIVLAGIR